MVHNFYSNNNTLQAEAGCGHRRQDKQPEVQEFTPEQIRGRPEGAAGGGGQTEGGQ